MKHQFIVPFSNQLKLISNSMFKKIIIEYTTYKIYVKIRPGAQQFLQEMSKFYEIIIFTASIREYADPVIDFIDPNRIASVRLFRENCTFFNNMYVKDLSLLNRSLKDIIIIDNSPHSYMFQPMNAIRICSYFEDPSDQELFYLIPFLAFLSNFYDVRPIHEWWYKFIHYDRFTYINKNQQKLIYQNVIKDEGKIEEQNSIFEEQSIKQIGDSNVIDMKIIDRTSSIQKSPAENSIPSEIQKLVKRNNKLNKSNTVNRNIQFNGDKRVIRVSTECIEGKRQMEETDLESCDIRNYFNINSPHGLESVNLHLFQSVKKYQL